MRTAALTLLLALVAGCGTSLQDIREGYLAEHPETKYAQDIRMGRVVVGMTEAEAIHAEDIALVRTWEDRDGWARYYARFGPGWNTRLAVYVRNGYVTSVMR